jgi:membrane-associated phospholipid phosphatase
MAVVACLSTTAAAHAQALAPAPAADTARVIAVPSPGVRAIIRESLGDFRRLTSEASVGLVVAGATMAGVAHGIDGAFTNQLTGAATNAAGFAPGTVLGGATFQFGAAAATYGVARLAGKPAVAHLGARLMRAQLVAHATTQAIKVSVRRMRPDGTTRNSFPSGHTSVSFASATVLSREFGWKVGLPAYAVASYIGLSRIEHRRHYLSDVLFGAAIGVMAGRSVGVTIGHRRFDVTPVALRGGAGVTFVWDGR